MTSWLVVGGDGQLGKALTYELKKLGIQHFTSSRAQLDIRSASNCIEHVRKIKPTVIVNAAAWTDVDSAESDPVTANAVNAVGALNLAIAAKSVGAIFAQISTDYVFSGKLARPWREDDLLAPVSVYGSSKALGESYVIAEYAEHSYIFRTAWLYSPWGKNFAKTMARIALFGEGNVNVVDDQVGQPTSAIDLANQIIQSVIVGLPFGIYHATNSGQGSWFDFAQQIFILCGDHESADRVLGSKTSSYIRPAQRPSYSVLGHESWNVKGLNGLAVPNMQDWKIALQETMPAIVSAVNEEG